MRELPALAGVEIQHPEILRGQWALHEDERLAVRQEPGPASVAPDVNPRISTLVSFVSLRCPGVRRPPAEQGVRQAVVPFVAGVLEDPAVVPGQ